MALSRNKQPTGYRKIMRNQPEYNTGFTLLELMITIAIAGILVGVAIPSFTSIITSNRLTAYANELVTALNLARNEAVKRGRGKLGRRVGRLYRCRQRRQFRSGRCSDQNLRSFKVLLYFTG
jgi:type IV fimbrial biogenesis protein FimT